MLAPTLIVGLGGRGSEIVGILSDMITDKKLKERINFVAFDTDVNELRELKKKHPDVRYLVQTSTNMTVGDYLHLDEFTRDNSFPVNPNLYRKTLTEGAGQVRAISHLAFITAMKRGNLKPLDDAIYDLYKLETEQNMQALRVIIVSTLAGGTGSGLILPVSMYIKQFLKTKIQIPGSITRGFFILPEIMYGVVDSEPMKNAFKANAYAVLRELNAFILKADGNLPARYKDKVHLMFPKVGTKEFEEYDVLPLDFSFMFDAQNIEGKKLNSTQQYLHHAATCIYAQSIGPMNRRSNSSEDNVIRTLVSGQSRNRYAGAGASALVYPSDHIINYIALKWASQTVAEHWTKFDRDIKKQVVENNKARLTGIGVKDIDVGEEYIKLVNSDVNIGDNPFSMAVKNASFNLDKDGYTITGNKWSKYIAELERFVKHEAEDVKEINNTRDTVKENVEKLMGEEKNDMELFRRTYNELIAYKEMVLRQVNDIGRVASYTLFRKNEGDDIPQNLDNQRLLETYMRDNSKEFMHPNAARYFLYQTLDALDKKLKEMERLNEIDRNAFANFEKLFDDDNDEKVTSIGSFTSKIDEAGFFARWTKKHEGQIKEYVEGFEALLTTAGRYRVNAPVARVLEEAKKYINNLSKSFESFYTSFDSNMDDISRQIRTAEDKYDLSKGNTIRYVCATQKCLHKFYGKMEFTGSPLQLPGDLCLQIYNQVRRFSLSPEINNNNPDYFKDIFNKVIIKHFQTAILTNFSADIKMDVIRALEVEAEYEKGIERRDRIVDYVKQVIKDTKKLSDPFINRPIGEEPVVIPACAYNKNLITDNPERKNLVLSELKSFGGVDCDDDIIDRETIMFYSAIYGLFSYDLLKFSPQKKSPTVTLEAGEYNKAYFDMISRIDPDPLKTPVITPHLDKSWHLISEMPDLSDEMQKEQEKIIYKALILGLLYDQIRYEKTSGDKYKYGLWLDNSSKEIQLTSKGVTCDTFYQIVDALTINPTIVKRILSAIDSIMETERKNNIVKYEQTALYKGINNLILRELSGDNRKMSIFGIAAAYKATTPPENFIMDQGLELLETTLEIIYEQIEILCPEKECRNQYITLIEEQFNLFTGNFELYRQKHPAVIDNYLRELLQVVIKVLNVKGFNEAKKKINEFSKHYFSDNEKSVKDISVSKNET